VTKWAGVVGSSVYYALVVSQAHMTRIIYPKTESLHGQVRIIYEYYMGLPDIKPTSSRLGIRFIVSKHDPSKNSGP